MSSSTSAAEVSRRQSRTAPSPSESRLTGADGVLDLQMASILARGSGRVHGIDSSPRMIQAAEAAVQAAGTTRCTFQGTVPAIPPARSGHGGGDELTVP